MKNIKDKVSGNQPPPYRGGLGWGFFLFFLFLNHCEAQNTQVQAAAASGNFPANKPVYAGLKEEINKRTLTSRTFKDDSGGVVIQYSSNNINYRDKENKFQPINAKLSPSPSFKERAGVRSGWSAMQQQYPTHLYTDGSTAIALDEKNKIVFNRNCKINGVEINYSDYTVGEAGMLINNVIASVDKKIVFYENRIETDYIIRQPMNAGNYDLIISEEIELPEGCYLTSPLNPLSQGEGATGEASAVAPSPWERVGVRSDYVVYSPDNKEQARFKAPVFYDADKAVEFGKYNLIGEGGVKYILQIIIPGKWLNDASRTYPITIDPVVTGPTANFPAIWMDSCPFPNYASDSMLITIPADITITKFIVEDSYFADLLASPTPTLLDGHMFLHTVCGTVTFSCNDPIAAALPGTCYLVPGQDLKSYLACCFPPSCSIQTFYLSHGLARTNLGPGCNQTYIYYSPTGNYSFSAYIVGKTVETAQAEWSVSPTTVCSDVCTISLDVTTNYGVPPYTITHPWTTGASQYGASADGCNSTGTQTITLTIPNCPTTCATNPTLSVPPPVIVDVCGDTVKFLSQKSITVKPVPVATANVASVCSGQNLSIPVSSCVPGSTFVWTGSNGSSGTGNINDVVMNTGAIPIIITYSVIPTASGCTGALMMDSAAINPLPVINAGAGDTVVAGASTQLNAAGGLTYLWSPTAGLSCINCSNPSAAPVITTSYTVTGTNEYGCENSDTVTVFVTQGTEVLYVPNSFSPNDNFSNDLFYVYGTSIKTIDIKIFNRWGERVFQSNDIKQGWDGKLKGTKVEGGVYVYTVKCEWLSGASTSRNGIVTVLR